MHLDSVKGRMNMMTDLELCQRMLDLFSVSDWLQGCNAMNTSGEVCKATDADASAFCLRGAAIHILAPDASLLSTDFTLDSPVSAQIPRTLGFTTNAEVVEWNDEWDRTTKEVLKLLKKRIKQIPIEEEAREKEREKRRMLADQRITRLTLGKKKRVVMLSSKKEDDYD